MVLATKIATVLLLIVLLATLVLLAMISNDQRLGAASGPPSLQFDSPIQPTGTPTPTLSRQGEIALKYLFEKYGLPPEHLLIVDEEPVEFTLIERKFTFLTIGQRPPSEERGFNLLVDLNDDTVEEDIDAIRAQEQAAYLAHYGRLHPALYERLQKASEDELIPIAIGLQPDPTVRSQEEHYRILVDIQSGNQISTNHGTVRQ